MIQIIKYKERQGFSLIEMIIATVLFLIAMTVSIGIFLSTIKANNKINVMQEVENEIRYIMEVISKEARLGTIYYDYYEEVYGEGYKNPIPILALQDNAGDISYFALDGSGSSPGIIQMSLNNGVNWSDLTTNSVTVDSLDFYLLPVSDPFAQDAELIEQPMVVIYLQAHYDRGDDSDGEIKIQTAISSRQYKK
jgi:prepilin-type N-terminal cleavage/methylation domain-containing protein